LLAVVPALWIHPPSTLRAHCGRAASRRSQAGAIADARIITRTAQQIGGSFGTAVLAVVLERAIAQHASAGIRGVAAGFDVAFWWSIAFTAVAIVLTLWLPARSPS